MSDQALGSIAGGIVGGVIGFFVGGPTGAALGYSLGSAAGGALFAPDGPTIEGPRLDDLQITTSSYGAPIPIVHATYQVAGNIIWLENNRIKETRHEEEVGGKGGGGGATQVSYTYSASFAIGLCEGPIAGVRRIWADTLLIYDGSDSASASTLAAGAHVFSAAGLKTFLNQMDGVLSKDGGAPQYGNIGVYLGDQTQLPNPLMEADRGAGNVPAYRGLAYLVIQDMQLEKFGNRIPNIRVEVQQVGDYTDIPAFVSDFPDLPGYGRDSTGSISIENHNGVLKVQGGDPNQRSVSTYSMDGALLDTDLVPSSESFNLVIDEILVARTSVDLALILYISDFKRVELKWVNGDGLVSGKLQALDGDAFETWNALAKGTMAVWHGHVYFITQKVRGEFNFYPARYRLNSEGLPGIYPDEWRDIKGGFQELEGNPKYAVSDSDELYMWVNDELHLLGEDMETVRQWTIPADSTERVFTVYKNIILPVGTSEAIYRLNDDGTSTQIGTADFGSATLIPGTPLIIAELAGNDHKIYSMEPLLSSGDTLLSTVIDDLAARAGLEAGDTDASLLTSTLHGYAVSRPTSAKTVIDQLRPVFQFDAVEADYQIKFVPRGGAAAATLTTEDLAAHEPGQDQPPLVEHARALEIQVPRQISVRYRDIDLDYEKGTQYATRLTTESLEERVFDIPLAATADEAAKMADTLLAEAELARDQYSFQLAMPHAALMPTDVINVPLDGGAVTVRMLRVDDGRPGIRKIEATAEAAAIYTSEAVGETGEQAQDTLAAIGPTKLTMLDIPLLRDQDDGTGIYVAAAGYLSGWTGAALYRSADGGATYSNVGPALLKEATVGTTTDALGDGDPAVWDRGNSVNASLLPDMTLSSTTDENVLNGANVIAIGSPGRWEIAAFRDADLQGDGTYTLSYLLRGLFGTEWAMSTHQAGDTVVLLQDNGSVQDFVLSLNAIELSRQYKGVSIGNSIASAEDFLFTLQDVRQQPLSPVHVEGSRDAAGNLTIKWIRRTRLGGEWRNYVDVPLGEESEAYEVDVLDGMGSVVRTITGLTSASASYTAADQTTDFGSAQSSVSVNVYQTSAAVGRGYAAEATV